MEYDICNVLLHWKLLNVYKKRKDPDFTNSIFRFIPFSKYKINLIYNVTDQSIKKEKVIKKITFFT